MFAVDLAIAIPLGIVLFTAIVALGFGLYYKRTAAPDYHRRELQ